MNTRFINTDSGMINVDSVVRITEQGDCWLVVYTDTTGGYTTARCLSCPEQVLGGYVPAHPGFSVVEVGEEYVCTLPVIAWHITIGGFVEAVTPEVETKGGVLLPDGRVIEPGCGEWDDMKSYINFCRYELKKGRRTNG